MELGGFLQLCSQPRVEQGSQTAWPRGGDAELLLQQEKNWVGLGPVKRTYLEK